MDGMGMNIPTIKWDEDEREDEEEEEGQSLFN
jgi:hypothetical protein